jgi:hypothetical protein
VKPVTIAPPLHVHYGLASTGRTSCKTPNRANVRKKEVLLVPRDDIRPEECCFWAVTEEGKRIGRIQIFAVGSAGYWTHDGDQAKAAASPEAAWTILNLAAALSAATQALQGSKK